MVDLVDLGLFICVVGMLVLVFPGFGWFGWFAYFWLVVGFAVLCFVVTGVLWLFCLMGVVGWLCLIVLITMFLYYFLCCFALFVVYSFW